VKTKKFFEDTLKSLRCQKTTLILGGLPILLTFLIFVGIFWPTLKDLRSHQKLLEQKKALIERYRAKLQKISPPSTPRESPEKYLFQGRDPYIVVSELQKELENIPEITLRSFRILKQSPFQADIQKVELNFDLEGDIKGLVEVLERVETFQKALRIQYLLVSQFSRGRQKALRINLRIEALFRAVQNL